MPERIIAITADVEMVMAAEGEPAGPKKFAVKVYNGGALQVNRWDYPVVIDLAGMKVEKSVIANLDHVQSQRVGHATEVINDLSKVSISGLCSAATEYRDEVVNSAADGFPWQASVEVLPTQEPDFVGQGETVEVNGQKFKGPIQVARKSRLYGFAFLSRGADGNTSVKIAAEAASSTNGVSSMNEDLKQWIEAQGFEADKLNDKQRDSLTAAFAKIEATEKTVESSLPTIKAGNDGAALMGEEDKWQMANILAVHSDAADEIECLIAAEEDSIDDKKKLREIRATARTSIQKLKKDAITNKWDETAFELEAVKAKSAIQLSLVRASRPAGPAIHASCKDINQAVLAAAVGMHGKLPEAALLSEYGEQVVEAAQKSFRSGIGLQELIFASAQANGWHGRSFKSDANECFRYATRPIQAGGFSNVDLSGILSNNANKFLLRGYTFVESVWSAIASRRPVNDFKAVTSYRMTGLDSFAEIAPDGRIKHGSLAEESYSNQAKTYGLMLAVTRTDIINDDLGAITTVPQAMGRSAGTKLNEIFWAEFMDNATFFTTARLNYFEGGTTNLSIDSLTTAEQKFLDMKDAKGKPVSAMPALLLVPTSISATASTLYASQEIRDTTASTKYLVNNPHVNKFRPIVSRYLGNSSMTNYSTTAWYLLADPNEAATIEVCFLNGVEAPTIEESATEFDTLGIQMRGFFDFGVAKQDYRVGVRSKGAA